MNGPNIKNYSEYLKTLQETYNGIEEIPSDEELQGFISDNNLFDDWNIVVSDVKLDVINHILPHLKKKKIHSYKTYLERLKEEFGIPKVMPCDNQLDEFITKFSLGEMWGITKDDVKEDLNDIIDGKYDEMYESAIRSRQKKQTKPVNYTYNRSTTPTVTHYSTPTFTTYRPSYSVEKDYQPRVKKYTPKHKEKSKKEVYKSEDMANILVDGDNHFDEGQKGIEHTSKNTKVKVFFSQPGAKRKFDKKYRKRSNVSSKLVKPGDQAVDNEIKAEAGRLLKEKKNVAIVSQDKGFKKYGDKKNKNSYGSKVKTAKSVKEVIKKKKKK